MSLDKFKDVVNQSLRLGYTNIGLTPATGDIFMDSCSLIYSRMIIGANGLVNACACRDSNFSLRIGDLNKKPLSEIISINNQEYFDLIERQEKNDFPAVCKTCDFYKSIYSKIFKTWSFRGKKQKYYDLKSFKRELKKR